jgi:hypothetical protein
MSVSKTHSSYWLDTDLFNDDEDDKQSKTTAGVDISRVVRLAAVRRAVANFVSILSGKNVPVQYSSGKQSYTDGETVVISAEEDPAKFDVLVGLALHEGSHILLSDFKFLRALMRIRSDLSTHTLPRHWHVGGTVFIAAKDNVLATILPKSLSTIVPNPTGDALSETYFNADYWTVMQRMLKDIQDIMNILEDRRIDQYVYQNAQGYRPYYDALYKRYFITKEMEKNLRFNPEWREVTIENYINRLLLAIHPAADPDALPGLRALINRMDLATIDRVGPENDPREELTRLGVEELRTAAAVDAPIFMKRVPTFEETPMLWREACEIYAHILQFVKMAPQPPAPAEEKIIQHVMEAPMDGLPNLDMAPRSQADMQPREVEKDTKGKGKNTQQVEGKFNSGKGNRELSELRKFMNNQLRKKQVKKAEKDAIEALETSDAQMVDLKGDGIPGGRCMVTRKMTDALLTQAWFIFGKQWWSTKELENAIAAGRRMGAILHHRLQVRNDPMMTKQTRLPQGGMDRRLLAQLGMDITSVFHKVRVDQHRPVMLHLTLDASGSMSGKKWWKVITVATAIAYISSKIQNVDAVISLRGGSEIPLVSVVYDSRRDQLVHYYKYIRKVGPNGATPEGLAFKATMDLILENAKTHDVYFVNFSDGEPAFSYSYGNKGTGWVSYSGDTAINHTRAMMKQMRESGVKVLSYFIHEESVYAKNVFTKMYGEDAVFVNVENATDVLRTLNKRLVHRGA